MFAMVHLKKSRPGIACHGYLLWLLIFKCTKNAPKKEKGLEIYP